MRKSILGILAIIIVLSLLSGCSNSNKANAESNKQPEPITKQMKNVDIGDKITEKGLYKVYYAGLIGDSVIINIMHDKPEYESIFTLNIPITRLEPVKLPFIENISIDVNHVYEYSGIVDFRILE